MALSAPEPSVDEFTAHPDFRQIAAFFLGWVFIISLSHMVASSVLRGFFVWCNHCIVPAFSSGNNGVKGITYYETHPAVSEKAPSLHTAESSHLFFGEEHQTLVFTLSLCFAFASFAQFASLLAYNANGGGTCAFVVAWGGMAAHSARLMGLIILALELRRLGVSKWEYIGFWVLLFVGLIFIFVTNAVSIGTIKPFEQLYISLCYRKHFLPTSLVASLIYVFLELYISGRLISLIAPPFMTFRHQISCLKDFGVLRALSLLLLELLTIVPSAINTGILGDFIPFSLGSLAVLTAFNYRPMRSEAVIVNSIPPSIIGSVRHSLIATPPRSLLSPPVLNHPSAITYSPDDSIIITARSSRTIDTEYAASVKNAVVQVASINRARTGVTLHNPSSSLCQEVGEAEPSSTSQASSFWHETQTSLNRRQILRNQDAYAERFEQDNGLTPSPQVRRPLFIDTDSVDILRSRDTPQTAARSIFYGSDIIRVGPGTGKKDAMKRRSSTARLRVSDNSYARNSYQTFSSPDSPLSALPPSLQRLSDTTSFVSDRWSTFHRQSQPTSLLPRFLISRPQEVEGNIPPLSMSPRSPPPPPSGPRPLPALKYTRGDGTK